MQPQSPRSFAAESALASAESATFTPEEDHTWNSETVAEERTHDEPLQPVG